MPRTTLRPGELVAVGLTIGHGSAEILRYVDFSAPPGSLTAIEGASGAGKSTLLHHLAGHATPIDGHVELIDATGAARADADFRRRATSRVFQSGNLVATLDVRSNVLLRLTFGDLRAQLARVGHLDSQVRMRLAQLGLGGLERRLPSALSGGQAQRVAIARALVEPTMVLIADEPTASLDPASGHLVIEALRTAAHDLGRTVVVASHDAALLGAADQRFRIRNRHLERLARPSRRVAR